MSYQVKSGDTLSKIALQNGVSLAQLIAANPAFASGSRNPNQIMPGEQLQLPLSSLSSEKTPNQPPQPCPVVCFTDGAIATCSHFGRKSANGFLEVTPAATGDVITLNTAVKNKCVSHPLWTISSLTTTTKKGVQSQFEASSWEYSPLPSWLSEVVPRIYDAHVASCSGGGTVQIRSYPSDKLSLKIDGKQWVSVKERINYVIDQVLGAYLVNPKLDYLVGTLTATAGWEECQENNLAYYKFDVALGFNPLLSASITVPIGPTTAIPQWVKKYGDAYFFVKLEGALNVNAHWARTAPAPQEATGYVNGSGEITLTLGGNLFVADEGVFNIEVSGDTGLSAELAKGTNANHPSLQCEYKWGGIKGNLTITLAYGIVEINRSWLIVDGKPLGKSEWKLPVQNT